METKKFEALVSRHSKKPKESSQESPEYPGISNEGVEYSKDKAQALIETLEQAEPGTILLFSVVSEMPRTRFTGNVYIDTLKETIENQKIKDISVIDESTIHDLKKGYLGRVGHIADEISANPEKKFVIHFPLLLKENALGSRWMAEDGKNWLPYVLKLYEKCNDNADAAFRLWLSNKGDMDGLKGPDPLEEAKLQIRGISRLREFVGKNLKEPRPIIIGGVGHSWTLDVMLVYLTNNGEVSPEGFDRLGGKLIGESNFAKIETREDGVVILSYNEKEYQVDQKLLQDN